LWFFFAVSGIKNPEAVLFLQQRVRLELCLKSGLMFKAMILFFFYFFMNNFTVSELCHTRLNDIYLPIKNASFDKLVL
jgi:hypothetical protein